MALFRSRYGNTPLHLLAVLASFAIAGYAFFHIVEAPSALGTLIWLLAAALAHDMLAFPLYSGLNLIAHRSLAGPEDAREEGRRVPLINHIRIPAALSVLAFVVFFPAILRLNSANYEKDSGLSGDVFLTRWLGLCAALFLGSALIYAIRLRRASSPAGEEDEAADGEEAASDGEGPPPTAMAAPTDSAGPPMGNAEPPTNEAASSTDPADPPTATDDPPTDAAEPPTGGVADA